MLVYMFQLIHSIQNYKNNVRKAYQNYPQNSKELTFYIDKNETIRNAFRYPTMILRYLFGGIFICFHLILFFIILIKTILKQTTSFKYSIFISILSMICVHRFYKMIIDFVNATFIRYHSLSPDRINVRSPISILIYFDMISGKFPFPKIDFYTTFVNSIPNWCYLISRSIN